jgi:hypothetical protein
VPVLDRDALTFDLAVALCNRGDFEDMLKARQAALSEFEDRLEARTAHNVWGYLSDAEREQHAYLVEEVNRADAALRALREGAAAA